MYEAPIKITTGFLPPMSGVPTFVAGSLAPISTKPMPPSDILISSPMSGPTMLGNQGKKAWHVNPIDLTHQTSAATFGLLSAVGPDAHAMIVLANADDGLVYANMSAAPVGFSQPLVPVYPGIHPSALVMTAISAPHPAQDLVMVLPGEAESSPDTLAWMANTHGSGHELSTPIPVFSNASMSRPILADVDGDGHNERLMCYTLPPCPFHWCSGSARTAGSREG